MNVRSLIDEGVALFNNKKFEEAIEKLNQALDGIEDKNSQIQEQNDIQFWLGRCYLEQAMKAQGKESEQLFGQAVEHLQQSLEFAKQLEDKQNSIQQQIYAQSWLGRCYLEQALKAKGKESEQLFEQAVEYFQQQLRLAEQLEDKQNSIQEQIYARSWLGSCYLEQVMKAKGKESEQLFEQAVEHFQQQLRLAEQLEDKQNSLQEQINAQSWLGRCYLEQAISIKDEKTSQAKILAKRAEGYFLSGAKCLSQLIDKSEREKLKKRINELLRNSYFLQEEKWQSYFDQKKQSIREKLFKNKKDNLTDAISTILAVLNISPIELGTIPLSHYTSPSVCERLFGIAKPQNPSICLMPIYAILWMKSFWERITKRAEIIARRKCFST